MKLSYAPYPEAVVGAGKFDATASAFAAAFLLAVLEALAALLPPVRAVMRTFEKILQSSTT